MQKDFTYFLSLNGTIISFYVYSSFTHYTFSQFIRYPAKIQLFVEISFVQRIINESLQLLLAFIQDNTFAVGPVFLLMLRVAFQRIPHTAGLFGIFFFFFFPVRRKHIPRLLRQLLQHPIRKQPVQTPVHLFRSRHGVFTKVSGDFFYEQFVGDFCVVGLFSSFSIFPMLCTIFNNTILYTIY